ncbi:hypothetical protein C2845_PM07G12660 [Panicum miliaceum]|uniref:Pectin acetylesterase n=1 Tax=Panicum miliaceum TaxID=4540 RepID=A0A3L6SSD5_PANMI|nr:hypothetical protein C2845_PM07G12660 [Panicum miliaceum]
MSTKLRPPLVPRRPPGVAVVAAAPLLLLLVLASSSGSPPVAVATGSPELVELTLLPGAQEKGAVCLDGPTGLPSAERLRVRIPQLARLSDFYDWNKVLIRYCDGASFSGDAKGGDQDGTKLFFRGLRIWEVVLDELMGIGLPEAKPALLAGCSAGGLATLLHCDNFRARFPQEVLVKCLKDAGFFLDIKDVSGERFMRSFCNGVVHLQNVRKVFPKDCLAKKDPTECFFAAELIKSISTPTFILNSDYDSWQIGNVLAPNGSYPGDSWSSCKANIRNCSSEQIDVLHGFRKKLVHDLKSAMATNGRSSLLVQQRFVAAAASLFVLLGLLAFSPARWWQWRWTLLWSSLG